MRRLFVITSILAAVLLASACESLTEEISLDDYLAPTVSSCTVTQVDNSVSINFGASVKLPEHSSYSEAGFIYGYDSSLSDGKSHPAELRDGSMKASISPNRYGSTLYCQAFIRNRAGQEVSSSISSYKIPAYDRFVTLTAPEVQSVTSSSVTVSSYLTTAEGISIAKRGFCYVLEGTPTMDDSCVDSYSLQNGFSATISGLGQQQSIIIAAYSKDSDGNVAYSSPITVTTDPVHVDGVTLNYDKLSLTEDQTATLVATITPSDAANKNLSWKSSNTSVATVDVTGKVSAVKAGTATITVTTEDGGKTATCSVTVVAPTSGVSLNKTSLELVEGASETLVATITPANASNKNVSWKSSNTSVATVSSTGKVTAVKAGTATITVTTEDGGKTATCEVTVIAPASGVSLNKSSLELIEGASETLVATITPANASNKNVSWKSSNTSVATVSSAGKVSAVKAGTATITVTTEDGGKTATCSVTVKATTVDPSKATDLSSSGTANCYIVSAVGDYKFKSVKGNTTTSVGSVSSASVVWETYGTSTAPNVGDLVNTVSYSNGYITFKVTGKEGNALIAAKDASGNILWSWHIWCTDKPVDQVYKNGAGTMMDRNLGATSATPGDVGALGLLYQWGRKDPFLVNSFISSSTKVKSTITWPSPVASNSSNGTIAYATSHPTTFITYNTNNDDWYYTGSSSTDNTRWNSNKGTYDPCPPGYRVPDGGDNGVWSKALGSSSSFSNGPWNSTNKGMDFKTYFTSSTQCWYPASGYHSYVDGSLCNVGSSGSYWSCAPSSNCAHYLFFYNNGSVYPYYYISSRASGLSVRCIKEGSMSSDISVSSVSLNKSNLTLTEGDSETLTATVSPSDATNKNVSWKSSNTSVATVSSSGKVTAVKAGSATITVTTEDGGKTATCSVTVKAKEINATDLSASGTANCYIVSAAGDYKLKTVKGNTSTSVGSVSSASVVWETFGTSTAPNVGDLVNTVSYVDGYITFKVTGKEGNALIAAKDASGNILWSWHIWCTDKPVDQVYKNGAGTMMDRNLGATSATPGDVGTLGLLYQWGRKDPFLGSSSISSNAQAKSTISWPSSVTSNSSNGTIAYATSHPTTFIIRNGNNYDWYYTGSSSTDDARWSSNKGTYDPCPPGYRVPDGGSNGVWAKALGSSRLSYNGPWNSTDSGMDFKTYFTSSTQCWYPASGCLYPNDGSLYVVGYYGNYWSCTPDDNSAYNLVFSNDGSIGPSNYYERAYGQSVRCIKEGSMSSDISVSSVSLNQSILTLTEGDTETLTAIVSPSDATNKNVSWKSSNTFVATVSSSGKVTAVKAGSATITVTTEDGGKTATCSVTVKAKEINATDLSASSTANCYIVSAAGDYKFKTVKGNTTTSVGSVSSASVVWETFGTSTAPNVGDLVNTVSYSSGYIVFRATGKEGNALIAAKDASGNILWSWHIWCTDKPSDQVYKNGAGTLMDRNLGATSSTPGDVGALGLLYQWGRKDPFLSGSSISSSTQAKSTITWPSPVSSNSSTGTIAYATSHPTTFITRNENNYDWYYTGSDSTDDTRWNSSKGTYDPCPPGYRVPDGGSNGVWSKALGSSSTFSDGPWNSTNKGMDFKTYFTSSTQCWYPASGFLGYYDGSLYGVGSYGNYWSCTPDSYYAYGLYFYYNGLVYPSYGYYRAYGQSVRCIKEGSMSSDISVSSVSLNKSSLTLTEGDSETLTATVSPSNATNKNVSWKSSDTSVASVSTSGKVTAVKSGTATITVTTADGGKTATCEVKVKSPCPDGAVDLGLSVYWASCNLGATKPEEYGGYYQWAGTQDVTSRSIDLGLDNCPYHTGSSYETGWTKYVPSGKSSYWSGSGSPDNKIVLDPDDDVAHVKLGGNWRMPTEAEFAELQNTGNCTWEWTTLNGVNGYKVTSKKSGYTGNWIFLPAAGYRADTLLYNVGSRGYYWSSSLRTGSPDDACDLVFYSGVVGTGNYSRYYGLSVRPVLE